MRRGEETLRRFPVSTDLYENDTLKDVSLARPPPLARSEFPVQAAEMLVLNLLLALTQEAPAGPTAAELVEMAAADAAYAAGVAAAEEDLSAIADTASEADAEELWRASSVREAAVCRSLDQAGRSLHRQVGALRHRAELVKAASETIAEITGAGRADERALGMLQTGLLTEATRELETASELSRVADEVALALVTMCEP